MPVRSRYRVDGGRTCIDIKLRSVRQLFDLRDPAPFRERDLDPGAVEHIMTCLQEIPLRQPVKLTLFLADPIDTEGLDPVVLKDAIKGHFTYERELVNREIRENFRRGRYLFVIGLAVLALFLTLSKASGRLLAGAGHLQEVVKEGLVITGWVAMWRPAEALLYDWWPLYEKRRWIDKLLASEIEIRGARASIVPKDATKDATQGASRDASRDAGPRPA